MPRRRRQRERRKSNRLNRQNNNSARAARFFAHFFVALHDYNVKMPNFTFCGGRKRATTKFFFLSLNLDMVVRNAAPEEFACIIL